MAVRFRQPLNQGGVHETEVPCYRTLNLLAHAQMEELPTGSRCGGHGVCGGDRVRVISGAVSRVTEVERRHLSQSEVAGGWRLACQCFPERDDSEVLVECASELVVSGRSP